VATSNNLPSSAGRWAPPWRSILLREKLYMKMLRAGSKPGTAHHVHRTIRNALNEAKRRGHLSQNPALLAKAPKLADDETEPYTVAEVRRLLALVADRRNGPR
jgi:hypothetical protein